VDDIARAGHGAHAAGEALIRVDKGAVFRNNDGSGRTGALAQAAADAAHGADIAAAGVLVRAEDDNGVVLEPQVDDALRAGLIARAAADAAALVDLGHAVGVQRDRAEAADLHARTAAGAAVEAKIVALRALVGAAAAVAVDAGNLGRELLSDFHLMQPPRYLRA